VPHQRACDAETTALLREFGAAGDLVQRREIAARIQARAHEGVSLLLAGQFAVPPAYRANLTGLLEVPVPVFWNVRRR
jgi:peptide/nickel transport system substrate-binding protein